MTCTMMKLTLSNKTVAKISKISLIAVPVAPKKTCSLIINHGIISLGVISKNVKMFVLVCKTQ